MNILRARGVYRPLRLHTLQTRRVSKQVWDCFGFLKDGTDIQKRASCGEWFVRYPWWRAAWWGMLCLPAFFLWWEHGLIDYVVRRRTMPALPVNYESDYPWRPPEDYENPLFAPARKWQKVREERRKWLEENKFNRPFYFKSVTQRPKRHKYRTGGR
eukprot:1148338_1